MEKKDSGNDNIRFEEHDQHIIRVVFLLGTLIVFGAFVRWLLIPDTFGQYGTYRGSNLLEQEARIPMYADEEGCFECHEKVYDVYDEGKHSKSPCQICHFSAVPHAEGDAEKNKKLADMSMDKSQEACKLCHTFLKARPVKHPQIKDFDFHYEDLWKKKLGEINKEAPCTTCHDAHSPAILKKKKTAKNE